MRAKNRDSRRTLIIERQNAQNSQYIPTGLLLSTIIFRHPSSFIAPLVAGLRHETLFYPPDPAVLQRNGRADNQAGRKGKLLKKLAFMLYSK